MTKSASPYTPSLVRKGKAQAMCWELFRKVEGDLSDAWISDDACTDDPKEYVRFVRGSLYALEDARKSIKAFLRKYRHLERKPRSWYCDQCSVEVYQLRCQHCGKSKRERA